MAGPTATTLIGNSLTRVANSLTEASKTLPPPISGASSPARELASSLLSNSLQLASESYKQVKLPPSLGIPATSQQQPGRATARSSILEMSNMQNALVQATGVFSKLLSAKGIHLSATFGSNLNPISQTTKTSEITSPSQHWKAHSSGEKVISTLEGRQYECHVVAATSKRPQVVYAPLEAIQKVHEMWMLKSGAEPAAAQERSSRVQAFVAIGGENPTVFAPLGKGGSREEMLAFGAKIAHEIVHAMEGKGRLGQFGSGEGAAYLRQQSYEKANGLRPTHANTGEMLAHIGASYSTSEYASSVKELYNALKPAGEALGKFIKDVYMGAQSDSAFTQAMRTTFGQADQNLLRITRGALGAMMSEFHLEREIMTPMSRGD